MDNEEVKKFATEIIGSHIQVYGHFEEYSIPDDEGNPLSASLVKEKGMGWFIERVYDYFSSNKVSNKGYYTDDKESLADERSVKRFIKKRVNPDSYSVGLEWLTEYRKEIGLG